jgi:predicted metal-dependent peptidase
LRATVLVCDAAIQEVAEIDENFDPYSIKGRGYGGTSSLPVFKWIEDEKSCQIKILVYFTDGYIDIPQKVYEFPTLWIVTCHGRTDEVSKMDNATVIQQPKVEGRQDEDDY